MEGSREYIISIHTENVVSNSISLVLANKTEHELIKLAINNTEVNDIMAFRVMVGNYDDIKYVFFVLYGLMTISMITVVTMIVKEKRIEWIFVFTTFFVGTMYMIALPPNSVPDESSHFVTAYAQSSSILGKKVFNEDGYIIVENERLWGAGETVPRAATYEKYLHGLLGVDIDSTKTETITRTPLEMRHLGYAPQVLGITIGRLLDFNSEQLYYIGRIFALMWYLFVMYWAIKLIPFGKMALFTIGMLPMTMQMVMSYNYDSCLLGCCFFLTSYLLYLVYAERKIKCKDVFLLSIASMVVASIKFIYLPILAVGLFISKEKFGSIHKKLLAIGWLGLLNVVTLLYIKLPMLLSFGMERTTFSTNPGKAITISYCLHNPVAIINMFYRTLEHYLYSYIGQMIATPLGWLEINIPGIVVYGFLFVLIASILCERNTERFKVGKLFRIVTCTVCLIMMLIALTAMLFDCTNEGSMVISGFQGRYWIPVLPLLIILLSSEVFQCKKDINKYLFIFMIFLHCFTISWVGTVVVAR